MITWNTDVNAPCCPGEIVNDDGRRVLVQTDWDYPGVADTFGWSLREVQRGKCRCGGSIDWPPGPPEHYAQTHPTDPCGTDGVCEECGTHYPWCNHRSTDGTVDCRECGVTAGEFITAAGEWLRDNDGATAKNPGYFAE